jgi:hypothetical protein
LEDSNGEKNFGFLFKPTDSRFGYHDGKYWFPVGKILTIRNHEDLDNQIIKLKQLWSTWSAELEKFDILEKNLRRLYDAIWLDKSPILSSYTSPNSQEVLDIFIRLNSGGKPLKKSDLLISTLSVYWPNPGEFRKTLDDLKSNLKNIISTQRIDDDFIMKSVLFMLADRVEYDIHTFNQEFAIEVHQNWTQLRSCLIAALRSAQRSGLDERTLTSANALLPIALFCKLTTFNPDAQTQQNQTNLKRIGKWLCASLLAGVYGGNSDSMLSKHREVIQAAYNKNAPNSFPDIGLNTTVEVQNKIAPYAEAAINNLLELNYSKSSDKISIKLALRLIQQRFHSIPADVKTNEIHLDHLIAQNLFPVDGHAESRHNIANLALMYGTDNVKFGDISLPEKFDRIANNDFKKSFLLADIPRELWSVVNYTQFLEKRRYNLHQEFIALFFS